MTNHSDKIFQYDKIGVGMDKIIFHKHWSLIALPQGMNYKYTVVPTEKTIMLIHEGGGEDGEGKSSHDDGARDERIGDNTDRINELAMVRTHSVCLLF